MLKANFSTYPDGVIKMKSILDSQKIPIPCDSCGKQSHKTIRWLKSNHKFVCDCGVIITININDFLNSIKVVDKNVAKLNKTIKNVNKSLRFS